jgi:5-methylcytosine-specific restriction endonuclease McrA
MPIFHSKSRRWKRKIVRERQSGICGICGCDWSGKKMHLLRLVDDSEGGSLEYDNLIGACSQCALDKSRNGWTSLDVNQTAKRVVDRATTRADQP